MSGAVLYGLRIESELDLPEIGQSRLVEPESRVEILRGAVPARLPGGRRFADGLMEVSATACLYDFPQVGRFLVEGGTRIVVAAHPDAAANDVRAFLFGSVMGTLLHQRRLVPLHISAIVAPDGVRAFTGPSGAGKSTMAASLHRATGWPVLCDDMAVLRMIDGVPVLSAGLVRLKLWKDALERLEIATDGLERDLVRQDKFHLSAAEMFAADGRPLTSLCELVWGAWEAEERLRGAAAFAVLLNAVYRPYLADLVGDRAALTGTLGKAMGCLAILRRTRRMETKAERGVDA